MSASPELVHVINVVVRNDGSFRVCEVYIPQGFSKTEDHITDDVFDALVNVYDRVMSAKEAISA